MAGTDRIDIADIDEIAPPFDLDGGESPAAVTPTIEAESEFDQLCVASIDDFEPFFETVTIYPASGGSREITRAIVHNRLLPQKLAGVPGASAPLIIVEVPNDATTGYASYELNDGSDEIELPVRLGQTAQRRRILRLLSHDYAWCKLEVR